MVQARLRVKTIAQARPTHMTPMGRQASLLSQLDYIRTYVGASVVEWGGGVNRRVMVRYHCGRDKVGFSPHRCKGGRDTGGEFENERKAGFPQGADALKSGDFLSPLMQL